MEPSILIHTLSTPVGELLLASTPKGLVRVAFEREDFEQVEAALESKLGGSVAEDSTAFVDIRRQIDEYFAGKRQEFELQFDFSLSTGFRRSVQNLLPKIHYGTRRTYKELAALTDSPDAVRAVGTACATNPLPLVIPCHRVVRSDGGLGGYLGGLDAKRALLSLELENSLGEN